jgi:hypothetical protein
MLENEHLSVPVVPGTGNIGTNVPLFTPKNPYSFAIYGLYMACFTAVCCPITNRAFYYVHLIAKTYKK